MNVVLYDPMNPKGPKNYWYTATFWRSAHLTFGSKAWHPRLPKTSTMIPKPKTMNWSSIQNKINRLKGILKKAFSSPSKTCSITVTSAPWFSSLRRLKGLRLPTSWQLMERKVLGPNPTGTWLSRSMILGKYKSALQFQTAQNYYSVSFQAPGPHLERTSVLGRSKEHD